MDIWRHAGPIVTSREQPGSVSQGTQAQDVGQRTGRGHRTEVLGAQVNKGASGQATGQKF
eukprot:490729-Rhodomonas_salina.1